MDFAPINDYNSPSDGDYDFWSQIFPVTDTLNQSKIMRDQPSPVIEAGNYANFRQPEISTRFRHLADKWIEETQDLSLIAEIISHAAYQEILTMNWQAVPLILAEMHRRPYHWFSALETITKVPLVREEDRGRIEEMTESWLQWGHRQNLC